MSSYEKHLFDTRKIVDNIILASDAIRYVLVVDENGEAVYNKTTSQSLVKNDQAMSLAKDIHFLQGLLKLYDDIIGENTFTHLIRSKGHVLMFYVRNMIFLVSCERNRDRVEIADLSDKIEHIIKNYVE